MNKEEVINKYLDKEDQPLLSDDTIAFKGREIYSAMEIYAIEKQITLLNNIAMECKYESKDRYTVSADELRVIISDLQQQLQKLKDGK